MAMIMCVIMVVASMCMITSATVFSADDETVTEANESSVSKAETEETLTPEETTVATLVTTEETTTAATETTTLEDVGAAIREDLEAKVRDIVVFDNNAQVYDVEGKSFTIDEGWKVWIIGIDDENQRFRVQIPKLTPTGDKVMYLMYADAPNAVVISHDGHVVGDLDSNGSINAKDFTLMKRYFLYGWQNSTNKLLADMSSDGEVTIKDLVLMQRWLLGIK
jgi:hypothetical protein